VNETTCVKSTFAYQITNTQQHWPTTVGEVEKKNGFHTCFGERVRLVAQFSDAKTR